MEDKTILNFTRAVQMLVSEEEFKNFKDQLLLVPIPQRKVFWHFILSGISTKTAFENCRNLYQFNKKYHLEYEELLKMILFVDSENKTGIYSKEIEMFELN